MFLLSELIVNEKDSIADLIDERARSFYSKFNKEPNTVYISPKLLSRLIATATSIGPAAPTPAPTGNIVFQTSEGACTFKTVRKYKDLCLSEMNNL